MTETKNSVKPIFRNLDGIRFIAFLSVYISHCFYPRDQSTKDGGLFKAVSFFVGDSRWGNVGLYIFFVMSGFLITYLLIHEHQAFGRIHAPSFYIRRILRIWPLYFLLLFINFFVYPYFTHTTAIAENRLPYFLFYANLDVITNGFNKGIIGHLWAISVEEQFYLLLPLLMILVSIRYLPYLLGFIIIASVIFRGLHYQEPSVLFHHSLSASFDIALGGLAAWLMYFSTKARNVIASLSRNFILGVYATFCGLILFQDYIFGSAQLIFSLFLFQLFAVFILLEQNYADLSFFKIGNVGWVTKLGKYAFGFYCYHISCIRFVEVIAAKYGVRGGFGEVVVVPALALLVTLLVGIASYQLVEVHFLKLKKKFTYLE
jgi:peptidoglycan/LPS O-acetylase OafA/YrhL